MVLHRLDAQRLVDIQAQVSDDALERLRFPKGVMTLVDEDTQRRVLAELDGVPIHRCAGGSAANTVIGVADFGGRTAYAGKVGDNELESSSLPQAANAVSDSANTAIKTRWRIWLENMDVALPPEERVSYSTRVDRASVESFGN